jgi:translation initiation factor 3 subunit J
MTDNWDDSDDEWDADGDELDARLGLKKVEQKLPCFDDEEDLALKEKEDQKAEEHETLKKKGNTLATKKAKEQNRLEEIELAKKAVELEADAEANLSPEELKALKRRQIEEADHALTDDLFGAVDVKAVAKGKSADAGEKLVLNDAKDHLKHARRVADSLKAHGKIHWATSFLNEVLDQSKSMLDEAAISDIIKTCNVIKNEMVQEAKRKVKGQAQKSKKVDKAAVAKARQVQIETFGDNEQYDDYDQVGANYEDAFF